MTRLGVLAAGIAALAPAATFLMVPAVSESWFPDFIIGVIGGGWVITIGFMLYAYFGSVVPADKRGLWTAVLFFGNFVVLPFFWYWYIWQGHAAPSNQGT